MNMRKASIVVSALAFYFFGAAAANAATLYASSDTGTATIGDSVRIDIKIDSEDAGINAAQATLQFPKDILEVVGVDKTNSVFGFWLEEPVFSNESGRVTFIGGSTFGVSGKSLQVLRVAFKVKGSGTAAIVFTDGAVTASDGSGTNVLSAMRGAEILSIPRTETPTPPVPAPLPATPTTPEVVEVKPEPVVRPSAPAVVLPSKPAVKIPLYPDEERWYNLSSQFFVTWDLPVDVTEVATLVSQKSVSNPTVSKGLFDNQAFKILEDGIWYLHVRFKNSIGWGPTAHYRIALDTAPPLSFEVRMDEAVSDNPTPLIRFASGDALSGIDHYSVRIDDGEAVDTNEVQLVLPRQKPGKHLVRVIAEDRAGNASQNSAEIETVPLPSPVIGTVSKDLFLGEGGLEARGTAVAGFAVNLTLRRATGQYILGTKVVADQNGNWVARIDDPLQKGRYVLEAVAEDERGALSEPVRAPVIRVRERPLLVWGGVGITKTVFFLGLLAIMALGMAGGWYLERLARAQRGRRVIIAERDVNVVFGLIKKDIDAVLKKYGDGIDARGQAEAKFLLQRLSTNLDKLHRYLSENIEEIND